MAVVKESSFAEDQFGKKVDRCITDTLVKAGKLINFIAYIQDYVRLNELLNKKINHFVIKMRRLC